MPVERKTKDCSATAAAQPRKPSSVASPIGPPPKPLPSSGGRLALTAFTIRLGGPSSSRTRASAAERASASLASAAIPSAPRSPTAAAVSSLCAMAAPRQPFCWRWSITAPPRLRAPRTTATRSACAVTPACSSFPAARRRGRRGAAGPGFRPPRCVAARRRGPSRTAPTTASSPISSGGSRIAPVPILLARRTRMPDEPGSTTRRPIVGSLRNVTRGLTSTSSSITVAGPTITSFWRRVRAPMTLPGPTDTPRPSITSSATTDPSRTRTWSAR